MKATVYLCGPMTGIPKHNFPLFFRAERELKKLGFKVVNPARMDVESKELSQDGRILKQVDARTVAKRDMATILDHCDGIVLLPGWKHSRGARAERALAEWMDMSILSYKTLCGRKQ